jgi:hypothetical protein
MNNHDDLTDIEELRAALVALTDRTTDTFLRVETLRALLVEHGVFSQAEFDVELQERHKLWSNRLYFLRAAKREAEKIAQRRQRMTPLRLITQ